MAVTFKLTKQNDGDPDVRTFEEWGLSSPVLRLGHFLADSLTCDAAEEPGATPPFAVGDAVTLTRYDDATPTHLFVGTCRATPFLAGESGYAGKYVFLGPWDQLERTPYMQQFASAFENESEELDLEAVYQSEVCLCENNSGGSVATGVQVGDVVTYAAAAGAPVSAGTVPTGSHVRKSVYLDINCAEAIKRTVERWEKNWVQRFDYNIDGQETQLTMVDLASVSAPKHTFTFGEPPLAAWDVNPNDDQKPAAVVVKYQRLNEIDGKVRKQILTDIYPEEADEIAIGNVAFTIPLEGTKINLQKQALKTATWPVAKGEEGYSAADVLEFLQNHNPKLADYTGDDIQILSHTVEIEDDFGDDGEADPDSLLALDADLANLPRYRVGGQFKGWMRGVKVAPITVETVLSFKGDPTDASRAIFKNGNKLKVRHRLMATNGVTKVYKGVNGVDYGEEPPTGLAQKLHGDWNRTRWRGSVTLREENCGDALIGLGAASWVGYQINIDDPRAAWGTMDAPVYAATMFLEGARQGETVLEIGAPGRVAVNDLLELQRANREQKATYRSGKDRAEADYEPGDYIEGGSALDRGDGDTETDEPPMPLPLGAVICGGEGEWKVYIETGKAIGWGGLGAGAKVVDIADSGVSHSIAAAKDFVVEVSLTGTEGEPMFVIDSATVASYPSGSAPASDVPAEGGGAATVIIPLFTVTPDGDPAEPPTIDPIDWPGGNIPVFEPLYTPEENAGSGSGSGGGSTPEDHVWVTVLEWVALDFDLQSPGTYEWLLTLSFTDILVKDERTADPAEDSSQTGIIECVCECDCCDSSSGGGSGPA